MPLEGKKAKELFEDRIFTLSNFISVSRVFMLPFFFYTTAEYAKNPQNLIYFYSSIALCLAAVLTDYLDGLFARLMHQETTLGRYLDPVCDKFVTLGGLVVVNYHFGFPLWILIVYFIREILGVWLGGFLYLKRGLQGKPNWWGKFGVGLVAVSVLWYMLIPHLVLQGLEIASWYLHAEYSAYVLLAVVLLGMIAYIINYWNIVFHPEKTVIDPENKKQAKRFNRL
ncbi:CDP-alcohol phosphatidyltransferase family protein [Leptospira ognonensis]|uniref:CDP-diacylglycerol--glycerol-3-phosphate 3-phosphatidyltransferase n=1 Tax=Leptospira ognonensis TaxID=2484945 RepID=A0A4R9JWC4_9LEPT|nr:CDP-alcohol phosphatidyltransferase family protein [Leptospira ognonensis]TGL57304.1 CDP-alcohol phosphatidyltransferase family protein [Leptospira ognonensis]